MRSLSYFVFRDILHDHWRSLLTIISLAVVVVGYLLLASLAQFFVAFGKQSQVTNNLVIISADALDPMESSLNSDILQIARRVAPDQILRAFPVLFRHLTIQGRILQVWAVPLDEMPAALGLSLLEGRWPSGNREIVISQGVSQATSWKPGSTVNIYGSDFQVTGLVRAGENNYGAVWMIYTAGQSLFGTQRGFQIAYFPLTPLANPEHVRQELQANPGISSGYAVYLENALSDRYGQVNHNLVTLSNIMALVSLLAIILGIYNATSLSLSERSLEIGLLRMIGFTQARLRGFLFARTLVLTLAAYGLGWGAALLLINYIYTHTPIDILVSPTALNLPPSAGLIGLGMATGLTLVGVLLTTGRLAALNPLTGSE